MEIENIEKIEKTVAGNNTSENEQETSASLASTEQMEVDVGFDLQRVKIPIEEDAPGSKEEDGTHNGNL